MKLLRMTATFGRLDHETLTLTDGLNLLQLPNEAGKSTWAEFLLAMFYGIDTSEREKTGVLPVKTKYQPWNGKAMEGTIELEQDGRRITLTRTSAARAPMSVFSAVYTDSGLPVEGLTGANCGERLLGVPKSVYQRSAFVRQAGLGLTPDESLESRLSALVTTGDETVSYAAADKRLQAWQNRVKHNKTGLIPDAERAIAAVEENLQTLAGEHQKNLELHAQLQQLQLQKERCEAQLRALEAAETQQKRKRLYDAKLAALQASNRENAAAAQCARLPQEGTLQTLSQEAAALLRSPEPEKPAPAPEKPACPPAFAGVDEERLMEKAQHDMREFDRLTAKKYRSSALCWIFAIAGLALAAVGWFGLHEILICAAGALIALGCVGLALLHARHNRRREQELDQAQALLALYGNRSRDEFAVLAADTREALRVWRAACSRAAEDAASYEAAKRLRAERTAALLGSVRMFSDAGTPAAAQAAIAKALAAYGAYHDAQLAARQAGAQYDALRQAFGELPELPDAPSDPPELTRPQAEAALADAAGRGAVPTRPEPRAAGAVRQRGGADGEKTGARRTAGDAERAESRARACKSCAGAGEYRAGRALLTPARTGGLGDLRGADRRALCPRAGRPPDEPGGRGAGRRHAPAAESQRRDGGRAVSRGAAGHLPAAAAGFCAHRARRRARHARRYAAAPGPAAAAAGGGLPPDPPVHLPEPRGAGAGELKKKPPITGSLL